PALAYSADGKRVLAWVPAIDPAGQNPVSNVRIFEAATGRLLDTIADRDRLIHCLAFSADGELAAMGGDDGSIHVWKTANAERLFNGDLPAHAKRVTDLIITPDKKLLITGGEDGEVKVWELEKIKPGGPNMPLLAFKAHTARITAFAVSPKSDRFVTTGPDNEVKLWDAKTGKELRRWDVKQPVMNLAFAPEGKQVVTANADSTLDL